MGPHGNSPSRKIRAVPFGRKRQVAARGIPFELAAEFAWDSALIVGGEGQLSINEADPEPMSNRRRDNGLRVRRAMEEAARHLPDEEGRDTE